MSDTHVNPDLIQAADLLQQALDAFRRGMGLGGAVAKPTAEPKTEPVKAEAEAPAEKVPAPKEPEIATPAVSIDEIRATFAKILLDNKVAGKDLIQNELKARNASRLSEVNPDVYYALMTDVVSKYATSLKKADPAHYEDKLEGMKAWTIPF